MSCCVIGQTHLETALSAYIFEYFVTTAVARNGENMTVPSQSLVFLYDTLGNVQKTDVRFGVGLLSAGDYPQVAVEECLQVVGGEVLHVGIRQTREKRKKHQSKGDRFGEDETQTVVCQYICSVLPHSPKCKLGQYNARFPLPIHYLFRCGLEADKQRS